MSADSNHPNDRDDEVDQLLRGAMKTLDDGVPSGYFEALPNRIQERLEMQTTSSTDGNDQNENAVMTMSTTKSDDTEANPANSGTVKREEDSGLHDIRSLAQSTRMRVSQNMTAVRPNTNKDDDDLLATSSAGWKAAVALPEPAKMISLPDLAELPSKADAKKAAKDEKAAAKAAEKASRKSADKIEAAAPVVAAAAVAAVDAPAAAASAPSLATVTPIGSRIAAQKQGGGNGMKIAIGAGLGIAAAAGIAFFVMNGSKKTDAGAEKANTVAMTVTPAPEEPKAAAVAPPPPAPTAQIAAADEKKDDSAAAAGSAAMASPDVAGNGAPVEPPKATGASKRGADVAKSPVAKAKDDKQQKEVETTPPTKVETKKGGKEVVKPPGSGSSTEQATESFDKLLDEAGVDKNGPSKTVKLEKKQLTGDDFKKGMASVSGAAMACYQGTQGTASIKLTISPDGKVKSVSVSGVFNGKPEATCVANAVRGATFPAWDGGPQTFGYSYLLQEK